MALNGPWIWLCNSPLLRVCAAKICLISNLPNVWVEVCGVGVGTVAGRQTWYIQKFFLSQIPFSYVAGNIFWTRNFPFHYVIYSMWILNMLHIIRTQHSELVCYDINNWAVWTESTPFEMLQCFLKKLKFKYIRKCCASGILYVRRCLPVKEFFFIFIVLLWRLKLSWVIQ